MELVTSTVVEGTRVTMTVTVEVTAATINHITVEITPTGIMIAEIMVATFNVIESTIAQIVMVHTGIGTNGKLTLGEITENTIIEISQGRAEGMTVTMLAIKNISSTRRENDILSTKMRGIPDAVKNHAWTIILWSLMLHIPVIDSDVNQF